MNILARELKAGMRSLAIWSVVGALFVLVGVSKFSAYYENPELLGILDSMPPALLAAFSMQAFDLTTVSGFFGLMFGYLALLLCIAAAMWGSDVIAREERDKTVEFALTLPVSRQRLVTGKALAALVHCVALLGVIWAVCLLSVRRYSPDGAFYRYMALCMLALFVMQLIYWAVGLLLGCALRQSRRAGSASVAVLLATYFVSVVIAMDQKLDFLRVLTPFRYFTASDMLSRARLDPIYVALSLLIVGVCVAGGYLAYARRDLSI